MPPKTDPKARIELEKASSTDPKTTALSAAVGNQTAMELLTPPIVPSRLKLYLHFTTEKARNKYLDLLSLSEIRQILELLPQAQLPPDEIEKHTEDLTNYLSTQYTAIKTVLDAFAKKTIIATKSYSPTTNCSGMTLCPYIPSSETRHKKGI